MDESKYIGRILKKIEEKTGWGNHEDWTDGDFRKLSHYIQESSGISISSHTLKRLFGKINYRSEYNPQEATKEAIAGYLGYDSWDDLRAAARAEQAGRYPEPDSERRTGSVNTSKKIYKVSFPLIIFAIVIIASAIYFLVNFPEGNTGKFTFRIENPIGRAPHTINMDYDFSGVKSDNILIDYDHFNNNGNYLTQLVENDSGRLSRCIHIPGKYNIKVFIDGKIERSEPVLVESQGWFCYAIESTPSNNKIPEMILPTVSKRYYYINFDNVLSGNFVSDGIMHVPLQTIKKIRNLSTNFKTHYVYTRPMDGVLDSSVFEVRFRNRDFGEGIHCYEASFEVIGLNGDINFQVVEPGCLNYAFVSIGDRFIFGETSDIEEFETEFRDYVTLRVETSNKQVRFYRNGKEFHTETYDKAFGQILGIHLSCKGTPDYDYVKLTTPEGRLIFNDDFGG